MNAAKNLTPRLVPSTVLVVEDEVLVRLVLADHLRGKGFRVIEANNGDEALSVLRSMEPVNIVVTDIQMPGSIDGVTLAVCAKQQYQLPVILVSGHYAGLLPTGIADTFIAKPYDMDSIFAAVLELLKSTKP